MVSRDIVVAQKVAQHARVGKLLLDLGIDVDEVRHVERCTACSEKGCAHSIVEREIEDRVHVVEGLELGSKRQVIAIDFTNAKDASTGAKRLPEIQLNVLGGCGIMYISQLSFVIRGQLLTIDTKSVNAVFLHKRLDVIEQNLLHLV